MRLGKKKKKKENKRKRKCVPRMFNSRRQQSNKSVFWICSTEVTSVICGGKHHIFNIRTEDNECITLGKILVKS